MLEEFLTRRNQVMQLAAVAQAPLSEETINAAAATVHQDITTSLEDHLLRIALANNVQFHPFMPVPELPDGDIDLGDVA